MPGSLEAHLTGNSDSGSPEMASADRRLGFGGRALNRGCGLDPRVTFGNSSPNGKLGGIVMGMRNPELPEHRGLPLNNTPPAGPVEPVASPSLALPVAAIYVKVSASGREDGPSLEVQVEKRRALVESEGYQAREEFIYREACAGADRERPELARLIADVCAVRVKALCFHDIGWWSGAVLHWQQLIDGLLSHDVQLRLVEGTLEDSPEGQLFLFVQGFSRKQERLRSIDRMKRGKAAVARMGRLPTATGAGLYGYDYDRTNRVRIVKEEEATVVRMMFEWASEGVSRYRIAMRLNELGFPTKTGASGARRASEGCWRTRHIRVPSSTLKSGTARCAAGS